MSRENYGMMNQEIQDDEVTIDLMELFSALWAKKTIIILSAIFMALVAFVGTKMFVTPKYTSVTKLFVMAKNDDTSASATYTDLQTGSMLTKDYMELVKSRPVLEKTISKLKLDVTPEELKEQLVILQDKNVSTKRFKFWKGKGKNEENINQNKENIDQ